MCPTYIAYIEYKGRLSPCSVARTTISLDPETRDRLKSLGRKGESYDDLVNRLIDNYLGIQGRGDRSGDEDVDFEQVR